MSNVPDLKDMSVRHDGKLHIIFSSNETTQQKLTKISLVLINAVKNVGVTFESYCAVERCQIFQLFGSGWHWKTNDTLEERLPNEYTITFRPK